MNVETLTMPKKEARDLGRKYARRARTIANREARLVAQHTARALRHVARGQRLIDIAAAIDEAPRDEAGRPRLAIARADRPEVKVSHEDWRFDVGYRRFTFYCDKAMGGWGSKNSRTAPSLVFDVPSSSPSSKVKDGYSLVPSIPATVDLPANFQHANHHILFEVERWSDESKTKVVNPDPFLLRRITGTLFAIIAEWDLTPIEAAVLRGSAVIRS